MVAPSSSALPGGITFAPCFSSSRYSTYASPAIDSIEKLFTESLCSSGSLREFCRQPGPGVMSHVGYPGGIIRIATDRIFAVQCVTRQAVAPAFTEMGQCRLRTAEHALRSASFLGAYGRRGRFRCCLQRTRCSHPEKCPLILWAALLPAETALQPPRPVMADPQRPLSPARSLSVPTNSFCTVAGRTSCSG